MSQLVWGTIIPSITSGNSLAALLNDFKEAVVSGLIGPTRPTELDAGGIWVDNSEDGSNLWYITLWTGALDIRVVKLNKTTGVASITNADSSFDILKVSDDSFGPALNLLKKRETGGGQTLIGDTLGQVSFYGHDTIAADYEQARIEGVSIDDVTSANKGAYLRFLTNLDGTGTLAEKARLTDAGKFIVGTVASNGIGHFRGSGAGAILFSENYANDALPAKVAAKKQRIAGNGQVLNNDAIGDFSFYSTDQNGAEIEVGRIRSSATENHTDVAQGNKLTLSVKANGSASFTDVMEISSTGVTILGASAAGKFTTYANEAITNGGVITKADNVGFQYRRISGNGGAAVLSTTPFGSSASTADGTVIRLRCTSDTNTIEINQADIQYGAMLNGDKILDLYDEVTLQYDSVLERWFEVGGTTI